MRRSYLLALLLVNACIPVLIYFKIIQQNKALKQKFHQFASEDLAYKERFTRNHRFLINNNVAQYSSYIIVDRDIEDKTEYRIEVYVLLNQRYTRNLISKEKFKCVVKFNIPELADIIEIESIESSKNSRSEFKRTYFLDLQTFLRMNYTEEYLLSNILVSVIWKDDFDKNLDLKSFMNSLNEKLDFSESVKFPYALIKFQKPGILKNIQPRVKSVALCIHYVYKIPKQILTWIDTQLSFEVSEIMLYDAIEDDSLINLINQRYGNDSRIIVQPYDINLEDLCDKTRLLEHCEEIGCSEEMRDYFSKQCNQFFELEFSEKYKWRMQHERITSNDCYTVMSQKYELIGYYDLDEFIYPRSLDYSVDFFNKKNYYSCNNSSSEVCELNVFKFNDSTKANKLYNYLQSQIEINRYGQDMDQFIALYFEHASFIIPNEIEETLINKLGSIISDINEIPHSYPIKLSLNEPNNTSEHTFLIQKYDLDYVRYLYKAYNSFIPCIYNRYIKNIDKLDKSLLRHLYFITEPHERFGKVFFYYKNVLSIYHHNAEYNKTINWWIKAKIMNGHYVAHFRDTFKIASKNYTGSIRKLGIDFEHVFYLLKNYTNFCPKY